MRGALGRSDEGKLGAHRQREAHGCGQEDERHDVGDEQGDSDGKYVGPLQALRPGLSPGTSVIGRSGGRAVDARCCEFVGSRRSTRDYIAGELPAEASRAVTAPLSWRTRAVPFGPVASSSPASTAARTRRAMLAAWRRTV